MMVFLSRRNQNDFTKSHVSSHLEDSGLEKEASLEDVRRQGLVENALFGIRLKQHTCSIFPMITKKGRTSPNRGSLATFLGFEKSEGRFAFCSFVTFYLAFC